MSARLEEAVGTIGPVTTQLFGQTEAPMMISTMTPEGHFNADGSIAGTASAVGRVKRPDAASMADIDSPPGKAPAGTRPPARPARGLGHAVIHHRGCLKGSVSSVGQLDRGNGG
jgi:hypothetical protein